MLESDAHPSASLGIALRVRARAGRDCRRGGGLRRGVLPGVAAYGCSWDAGDLVWLPPEARPIGTGTDRSSLSGTGPGARARPGASRAVSTALRGRRTCQGENAVP